MSHECSICLRSSLEEGNLCKYHAEAKHSLEEAFGAWERAYKIGWEKYLEKLLDEEDLGDWAREVVIHLIERSDS